MFDTARHEPHESPSALGQTRDIFLPPLSDAIESIIAQTSRKRKLTDAEHGNDIGEVFTIKVWLYGNVRDLC